MDISVIIVNWNTRDLLLTCVGSIYEHTHKYQVEIIVVDNASQDDSVEAVRQTYPDVRVICNDSNVGFGRANNIGYEISTGRYIALVNSDIELRPDCLDNLLDFMEANKEVGMVGPKLLFPDLSMQWSCRRFPNLWIIFCLAVGLHRLFPKSSLFPEEHMTQFAHDRQIGVDALVGALLFVRREAIDEAGLFDESFFMYSEEIDLCKRFHQKYWDVVFYPGAEAIHNCRASSKRDPLRFNKISVESSIIYWRKHHGLFQTTLFINIIFIRYFLRYLFTLTRALCNGQKRMEYLQASRSNQSILGILFRRMMEYHGKLLRHMYYEKIGFTCVRLGWYFKRFGFFRTIKRSLSVFAEKIFYRNYAIFGVSLTDYTAKNVEAKYSIVCRSALGEITADELAVLCKYRGAKIADFQLRDRLSRNAKLWLIKNDLHTVGMIWMVIQKPLENYFFPLLDKDIHLFDNEIFADYRGQGINTQLLRSVLSTLKDQGFSRIYVETRTSNVPELKSLKKNDFNYLATANKMTLGKRTIMTMRNIHKRKDVK